MRHFADPHVGAVAGNVKVGNRNRWLTRWQALEYITSQNLEKRAFDLLNCIPVVPGALSAWRAEAIASAGGFTADTVAEDTDLTIAIRRIGWRIAYDEEAIGWTEAPETADALIRQRFRWTFGTLQSFWKHRDTLGRPRYGTLGCVALPNIFLFQLLLPLVSPVIDLLFLGSLALWGLGQFHVTHLPQLWTAADVERSVIFFIGFMLIDLLTCVIAFALERRRGLVAALAAAAAALLLPADDVRGAVPRGEARRQGGAVGWRGVEPEVPAALVPSPTSEYSGGKRIAFLLGFDRRAASRSMGAAPEDNMSTAFDAGNGKITVPDILARKSRSVVQSLHPRKIVCSHGIRLSDGAPAR